MKHKMGSVIKLLKSKMYILVTDKETVIQAHFKGFEGMMMLHGLKEAEASLTKVIAEFDKKGKANARDKTGRQSSSRDQQGKIR